MVLLTWSLVSNLIIQSHAFLPKLTNKMSQQLFLPGASWHLIIVFNLQQLWHSLVGNRGGRVSARKSTNVQYFLTSHCPLKYSLKLFSDHQRPLKIFFWPHTAQYFQYFYPLPLKMSPNFRFWSSSCPLSSCAVPTTESLLSCGNQPRLARQIAK